MNPLTLVKRIQNLNSREAALGISDEASWHAKYKDSAYIFVGGIPFDLTEGDLLAVFSQYGEIVDVNLVRDKGTGKSKGFAFVAYEDQRSTNLVVDNLNGAQILGRIIRVDHVTKYKKKEEDDDEETLQKKREERGVCRAFQRGECKRGAGCKFSHDEQRAANTGWGSEDNKSSRWGHDKFGGSRSEKRSGQPNRYAELAAQEDIKADIKDVRSSRGRSDEGGRESHYERNELHDKLDSRGHEKRSEWREREIYHKVDRDRQAAEKRSAENNVENFSKEDKMDEKRLRTHDFNQNSREKRREEKRSRTKDHEQSPREDRREDRRSRCFESEPYHRDDREDRGDKRSTHGRDSSLHCRRGTDEDDQYRSRR